jgi:hypothetical protein
VTEAEIRFHDWLFTHGVPSATAIREVDIGDQGNLRTWHKLFRKQTFYTRLLEFAEPAIRDIEQHGYNPDVRKLCRQFFTVPDLKLLEICACPGTEYIKEAHKELLDKCWDTAITDPRMQAIQDLSTKGCVARVILLELYTFFIRCGFINELITGYGASAVQWAIRHHREGIHKLIHAGMGTHRYATLAIGKANLKDLIRVGELMYVAEKKAGTQELFEPEVDLERHMPTVLHDFWDTVSIVTNKDYAAAYDIAIATPECERCAEYIQYYDKIQKLGIRFKDAASAQRDHEQIVRYQLMLQKHVRFLLKERNLPLPDPPLPTNEFFKYIDCTFDLEDEGLELKHCVSGYNQRCLDRESFIYRFEHDDMRGTVEVTKEGMVRQFRGYKNARMTKEAWQMLKDWAGDKITEDAERNAV